MEKYIFCGTPTSIKFSGEEQYNGNLIYPKCQSKILNSNFNTGCADDNDCLIKIK